MRIEVDEVELVLPVSAVKTNIAKDSQKSSLELILELILSQKISIRIISRIYRITIYWDFP